MAKGTEGWKVTAISVRFIDGKRVERPFEDFTPQERKETAQRMNDRALRAAGYFPVNESTAPAAVRRREERGVMAVEA